MFQIIEDSRPKKGGREQIKRVTYRGECIAIFGDDSKETPENYISTHGYMAEYRRRWNNGDRCNWSEELRVENDKPVL